MFESRDDGSRGAGRATARAAADDCAYRWITGRSETSASATRRAVGPDVRGVQVGQRVIPIRTPGTWQEFLVVNPTNLIPAPDSLSDESAAQFVVNPLAAWIMVTEELALQP